MSSFGFIHGQHFLFSEKKWFAIHAQWPQYFSIPHFQSFTFWLINLGKSISK